MQCPYCKNQYISYAVLEYHLLLHGCTEIEAKDMIERIKEQGCV